MYASSPVEQPGTQILRGASAFAAAQQRGEDLRVQRSEDLRIAEEARDVDEQVVVEGRQLRRIRPQAAEVLLLRMCAHERDAARDPAPERRRLVARDVHPGPYPQELHHLPERRLLAAGGALGARQHSVRGHRRAPGDRGEVRGDPLRRQDQIDDIRRDRAPGHPVVHGRGRLLRVRPAARRADRPEPFRPVGARARQDHADGVRLAFRRERPHQRVDRHRRPVRGDPRAQPQATALDRQRGVRRDDVDLPGRDRHPVLRLDDRERRRRMQGGSEQALMRGGEVLHDDGREVRARG